MIGTIMTIAKDKVRPSPTPDSWKLPEIFATGVVIGTYLALVTVLFYWAIVETTFFETHFHVTSLSSDNEKVSSTVYLQVSIISQALIFVTRSWGWSFLERPGASLIAEQARRRAEIARLGELHTLRGICSETKKQT